MKKRKRKEESRVFFTLMGFGLNVIYAVFNGAVAITGRSAWYGSLSAYYLLLSMMRFLAMSYARRASGKKEPDGSLDRRELNVYRNCGIMLAVMSIALGGAVLMLVLGEGGKSYPGLMIYAAATYTFIKLTMSIINVVKAWKEKSLLLLTLRNISYSDALVSVLSLQTALLAAFGQEAGTFITLMNGLTGVGICLMVLGLGIYMVRDARRRSRTGKERKK
ncbi:MAG: hypothetical protein Q4F41_06090 [Eubacteriales bacterium]|nr:hypothetical protein [Eubacteriales bacterium]